MVGIYHKYRTLLVFSDTVSVQFCGDMHLIVFFGHLFSVLLFRAHESVYVAAHPTQVEV
jgi:hypothetical protein